jgi:RNA polymerase sigma factor (sigma-70 family)
MAIDTLYGRHHGWLHAWLCKRLGNTFDAADIAHDTYVRIISTGNEPPIGESRRFLTRIAKGLAIDLHRRRRIEAAYLNALQQLPDSRVPSEEARACTLEALLQIDSILHSLPVKVRHAFLLSRLEGLSYAEIAARLGVSTSSVEKYVARTLVCFHHAMTIDEPRSATWP